MDNRYKIILSNHNLYKEIELTQDTKKLKVGTAVDCDIRLRKEMFFEQIELLFVKNETEWTVFCSDNLYLTIGDVRKLMTKSLQHGDTLQVKYQEADNVVFSLDFIIDFDDGKKKYDGYIDVSKTALLKIGGSRTADIVIQGPYIDTNDMVVLERKGNRLIPTHMHAKYGVYHNGKLADIKTEIQDSDFFSIADHFFYYKDNQIWLDTRKNTWANGLQISTTGINPNYPKFIRNTRIQTVVSDESIEILDPPTAPQKPKNNIFMQLLPSFTMLIAAGAMAAFGGVTMLIFSGVSAVMSIITAILSIREGNKEYRENCSNRIQKYQEYIEGKREEIEHLRETEKKSLERIYLNQGEVLYRLEGFSPSLFDRRSTDADFLCVMLGKGKVAAERKIDYKKQERIEFEDELQQIPEDLCKQYQYISDAPVICNLKNSNAVGIVGDEKERFNLFKNMIIDLAARHYHTDVKMFFVAEEKHREKITWLRFLPHAYNDDVGIRNMVCDDESKNLIFEYLYKELTIREQRKQYDSEFIVFFYDEYGFKNHPISKFTDKAKDLGVTFVFFGDDKTDIPMGCDYLIISKGSEQAEFIDTGDESKTSTVCYPTLTDEDAKKIVTLLAPVYTEEISLEGSLTKNISLFELLNIIAVDDLDLTQRWATSQVFKSMAAPLGVSKTEMVHLDLHDKAHGPHGLVAGTTGSGKSEILQTYILAMATLFHPYEVGFVIIDFKGGGMVNQFKELPHLLGAITNIDGKEIDRSLKSIKAELQKRQRLFAEADVNHIDKYIKKFKAGEAQTPLPHLIIIVDEFAELKAEQPEFMKELISAARIGRSLGVHLILATQKPAGQVDEQIWSNSRFKLCLKVQSQEDSNEVLKSPLAAEIKEPGRAYLQVGNNEIFELFQSAYSGASEKVDDSNIKEFVISELNNASKRIPVYVQKKKSGEGNRNQLDAIVEYVSTYCQDKGIVSLNNICLPPLPETISFSKGIHNDVGIVDIGLFDDPDNQLQSGTHLDVSGRNTLIVGASQYGKTNLLQLMIRAIAEGTTPKESNIYILDFGSMVLKNFEDLHHVGGVVSASEDEKLKNLFKMLYAEIADRKEKLVAAGVSSFTSYLEAGHTDLPQIYLMIDNMTALMELYLENDDSLLNIIREGLAVGISTIVANAQTSGIGFRYMSNFSNKIALYCNDSNEYRNVFEHVSFQPDEKPGRCILEMDKRMLECQTYLAFEGEREFERVQEMKAFVDEINGKYPNSKAKTIPCIPTVLPASVLEEEYLAQQDDYRIPVGLTYNEVKPYYMDFTTMGLLGLCGRESVGHRNFVEHVYANLELNASRCPARVVIFDDIKRKFADFKDHGITALYTLDTEKITEVVEEWYDILQQRYEQMMTEEDSTLESELLLMIIQNNDVAKIISDDMDLMDKFGEMVSRFKGMNVAFIFTNYPNTSISYDAPEPIRMVKQEPNCIFFEDLDNLKAMDIPYEAMKANRRRLETGDAYYICDNEVTKLKMAWANR